MRRTQAERSAETKERLAEAAIACLVEDGYAYTSTVSICERAGVTRGAYNHHYANPAELFEDVLEQLYSSIGAAALDSAQESSVESVIQRGWTRVKRPEFKAVIEIWLAARNDASVGSQLATPIAKLSRLFDPHANQKLAETFGANPEISTFYRLAFETMIGLALGRATSPKGAAVEHEEDVVDLLLSLAREHDRRAKRRAD